MHIPATSSITTRLGSFPQIFSTIPDDHTPNNVVTIVIINDNATGGVVPAHARYQQIQQNTAAIVPPPLMQPMPKVEVNILWKSILVVVRVVDVEKIVAVVDIVIVLVVTKGCKC